MSPLRKRLALLVVSLLLALLVGEFVLRWRVSGEPLTRIPADSELHTADPLRSYRLVPGAQKRNTPATRINALGLRGPELAAARTPGAPRILCIGDSITYGERVQGNGETWPAQLQHALEVRGHKGIEVLNGGVMGYGSRQCLAQLQDLLPKTTPDLVLCCVGWNDITFARIRGWHPGVDWVTPGDAWQWNESYFVDYVRRHLFGQPRAADPRALEFYEREVAAILETCRKAKVKVAFLDLPTVFAPIMSAEAIRKAAINLFVPREATSFLLFRTRWQNLAKKNAVPLLFTGFEYEVPCSEKEPYLDDVCHPTKDGYAYMVGKLVPQIEPLLQQQK